MNKTIHISETLLSLLKTANAKATKANEFALNKTEEIVTKRISATSQWQQETDKTLKSCLKFIENKQNKVFNSLENCKNQFMKRKEKFSKIFA